MKLSIIKKMALLLCMLASASFSTLYQGNGYDEYGESGYVYILLYDEAGVVFGSLSSNPNVIQSLYDRETNGFNLEAKSFRYYPTNSFKKEKLVFHAFGIGGNYEYNGYWGRYIRQTGIKSVPEADFGFCDVNLAEFCKSTFIQDHVEVFDGGNYEKSFDLSQFMDSVIVSGRKKGYKKVRIAVADLYYWSLDYEDWIDNPTVAQEKRMSTHPLYTRFIDIEIPQKADAGISESENSDILTGVKEKNLTPGTYTFLRFNVTGTYSLDYELQKQVDDGDWKIVQFSENSLSLQESLEGKDIAFKINYSDLGEANKVKYRLKLTKIDDNGSYTDDEYFSEELTLVRMINVKPAIVGSGSLSYTYNGVTSTSSDGINILADKSVSLQAIPGQGQRFDGWYSNGVKYATANPLTISGMNYEKQKNFTAKFVEASADDHLNVYVSKYTHEGSAMEYTSATTPAVLEYNYGEDAFELTIDAASKNTYSFNQDIYYQIRVDGGDWSDSAIFASSARIPKNEDKYSATYTDPKGTLKNAIRDANGKSVELRFVMSGDNGKGTSSVTVYSNPIVFLVKHKVLVSCLYGNQYTNCTEAKASFVDENGKYYDDGSVKADEYGQNIWRWYYVGETAKIATTPKYDYALKQWNQYKSSSISSSNILETYTDTLVSVTVDGSKFFRVEYENRVLKTRVVQTSSLAAGSGNLSFYAEGDQTLEGVTLQKKVDAFTYEDVDAEAADFVLAPGEYRLQFTLGFKNENDRKLATKCNVMDCSGYAVVEFDGFSETNPNLTRTVVSKSTDETVLYGYYLTVENRDFNVTFYDGDDQVGEVQKVAFGEKTTAPEDPKEVEGYAFDGWYLSNGAKYDFDYAVTSDLNLYARRSVQKFTVTYVYGKTVKTEELEYGAMPSAPAEFTCPEKTAEFTYSCAWNKKFAAVTDDATYTFSETAIKNKYAVSVAANDSKMGSVKGAGTYEYGTEVELVATAAEGYKFSNWEDDAKAAASRKVVVKADAEYTANFSVIPSEVEGSSSSKTDANSSSSEAATNSSSSRNDTENSSSSAKDDKSSSSSSAKSNSSSSVKQSSSSSKPESSSSAKPASSSSEIATNSSSSAKPNSSSSKTETIVVAAAVPQFSLSVAGRNVQIAGARIGSAYAILDMQGRVLATGRTASASMEIAVPRAGSYMVRVGSQTKRVNVK